MNDVPTVETGAPQAKSLVTDYFKGFDFAKLDTGLDALLKAGVHFGHVKSRRHPSADEYIFTTRKNINIINLEQTAERLEAAQAFVASVVRAGKPILFVGMKKQTHETVESLARQVGQHFVVDRWLGGTLTNFTQIRSRAKYLKETQEKMTLGEFKKYTKFEQSRLQEEIAKLEKKVGGIKEMTEIPGVIILADAREADLVQQEARRMKVPLIGIVDTNTDSRHIDYPIPGNDDAVSSLRLLLGALGKAILAVPARNASPNDAGGPAQSASPNDAGGPA
jgi:small subunit ribosomal protein S2